MADVVQFRMERMSDELDDLERRGLLTRPEIAEIVHRRREFEYRLKRPSPLKQDYISYIEYELQVDALRDLRKKKIIGELRAADVAAATAAGDAEADEGEKQEEGDRRNKKRKKGSIWKKSVSDVAGVLRILDVYRLVTMRFKGDLELWFRYLEFCRERRHGRMKQVLAQAVRYHPKVPGLWIYAAAWEFDQNLNVAAARALMQSGLRACPKYEDLWIEYLRMELTYLNKLKARKAALGENVKVLGQDRGETEKWKEQNKELFMPLNEEIENGTDLQEGALEKNEDLFWQQGSVILQTIYHGAVEALPSSMSLRKRFLEILDTVDLAHSDKLKEEIMQDLKKNFSNDVHYWDWKARLQISGIKISKNMTKTEFHAVLNKAIEVYEDALMVLPSVKMFSLCSKFWLDMLVADTEDSNTLLSHIGMDVAEIHSYLLKIYEKAELNGCLTEELAFQYISFSLQMGNLDEARGITEKLCDGKLSEATKLWTLRVSLEMKRLADRSDSTSKDGFSCVFKLLQNVLNRVPISETEELWLIGLKFFSSNKEHFEKLVKVLMKALTKAGGNYSRCAVSSAVVNWVLQRDGIQHAREMYMRFLALPHPSLGLYRHCIELESNIGFLGNSDGIKNARKLYESALSLYGQNEELWKDYYTLEMKAGTSETANAIYWRARKILTDTTALSIIQDL